RSRKLEDHGRAPARARARHGDPRGARARPGRARRLRTDRAAAADRRRRREPGARRAAAASTVMSALPATRAQCEALDAADPLAPLRASFALPEGVIYLDGNSLGALPAATPSRVADAVERQWGRELIRSWNTAGWVDLPQRVGAKIASLVGARPDEVVAADATSVNLFKLLSAALRMRPDRRVILSEAGNFPTDLYIAQGLIEQLGGNHALRLVERDALPEA